MLDGHLYSRGPFNKVAVVRCTVVGPFNKVAIVHCTDVGPFNKVTVVRCTVVGPFNKVAVVRRYSLIIPMSFRCKSWSVGSQQMAFRKTDLRWILYGNQFHCPHKNTQSQSYVQENCLVGSLSRNDDLVVNTMLLAVWKILQVGGTSILMLWTLTKNFSRRHIFPRKRVLTFHANGLQRVVEVSISNKSTDSTGW